MKQFLLFLFIISASISFAQTEISFDYDPSGNQIIREIRLRKTPSKDEAAKEVAQLTAEDLQKFAVNDAISYYPNPVKEQLYLKWELADGNKVSTIQVYSLTGQLLKMMPKLEASTSAVIDFNALPNGIYNVLLHYTNGENKSIKIIK